MLTWLWLGRYDFLQMLELQEQLFLGKQQGDANDYLIFVEHQSVYTYDARKPQDHLWRLPGPEDVPVLNVHRAGSVSYHGPGQLVCYCIFDLMALGINGPLALNEVIDETIIRALAELGIVGHKRKEPVAAQGIWVMGKDGVERKIASRGVSISRNISRFGFALNVYTDLSFFDYIYPCGIDIGMTSLEREIGGRENLEETASLVAYYLKKVVSRKKE